MKALAQTVMPGEVLYFGKLPSRGDFVRSGPHGTLVATLDVWLSQTMDRLSADPRWKLVYDAALPVHFAILGTGSSAALVGHWLASQDSSGRRFPFVTAAVIDVPQARTFVPLAPEALAPLWARLDQLACLAHAAADLAQVQPSLQAELEVVVSPARAASSLADFLDTHTVASLEQMLAFGGGRLVLRQAVLALGLLLLPAMAQGSARLSKVLRLPLPGEGVLRGVTAAFWMTLVQGFFARHDIELAVFVLPAPGCAQLVLGFQGASAAALQAVIDPDVLAAQSVSLEDSAWVEDEVGVDYGLRKLSNYLRDPGLSLAQVVQTFQEVFLGQ